MRPWYKFFIDTDSSVSKFKDRHDTRIRHERWDWGYCLDGSYADKNTFFDKYFYGYSLNRLEYYHDFLRTHLKGINGPIISVASGRCANELFLIDREGINITCSEVREFEIYDVLKKIEPRFKFIVHDILKAPFTTQAHAIVCLSLIYLFNDEELHIFFRNVSQSLCNCGIFLLDSSGARDNILTRFLHHFWLKYETLGMRFLFFLTRGKWPGVITEQHGFFRTDDDIIRCAQKYGLQVETVSGYAPLTDFYRSRVFGRLIRVSGLCKKFFECIGRLNPYIRMFKFKKI